MSAKPPWVNASLDKVLICWVRSTTLVTGEPGESGDPGKSDRLFRLNIASAGPYFGINNRGGGAGGSVIENVGNRTAVPACDVEDEEPPAVGDDAWELSEVSESSDPSSSWTLGDEGGDRLKYVLVGEPDVSVSSVKSEDNAANESLDSA
jgi:hypothetical protein